MPWLAFPTLSTDSGSLCVLHSPRNLPSHPRTGPRGSPQVAHLSDPCTPTRGALLSEQQTKQITVAPAYNTTAGNINIIQTSQSVINSINCTNCPTSNRLKTSSASPADSSNCRLACPCGSLNDINQRFSHRLVSVLAVSVSLFACLLLVVWNSVRPVSSDHQLRSQLLRALLSSPDPPKIVLCNLDSKFDTLALRPWPQKVATLLIPRAIGA